MPIDRDVVSSRIAEIRECIRELLKLASKPYEELSIYERYSMRYLIIVLVEALVSLCIHVAKEVFEYVPKSYVDCVKYVGEKLGVKCLNDLIALVKLRNLIVHRYWVVDDREIRDSIVQDFKCVNDFIRVIEREFL